LFYFSHDLVRKNWRQWFSCSSRCLGCFSWGRSQRSSARCRQRPEHFSPPNHDVCTAHNQPVLRYFFHSCTVNIAEWPYT